MRGFTLGDIKGADKVVRTLCKENKTLKKIAVSREHADFECAKCGDGVWEDEIYIYMDERFTKCCHATAIERKD